MDCCLTGGGDVRDVLAKPDGEQNVRDAIENAVPWEPPIVEPSGVPSVALPGGDIRVSDCAKTLGNLMGTTGRYFSRGGALSRLDSGDDGAPILTPLKPASLPSAFEGVANLIRETRDREGGVVEAPTTCSEHVARVILNAEQFIKQVPVIRVLTRCPVLLERGNQLVEIVNYDRSSGVMAGGWGAEHVSTEQARSLLETVLQDFNFATPSDKSRAAAAIITPALVFGGLLGGRPPIDLGEADLSQAGKGFRNKLTTAIYGHTVKTVTQRNDRGVGGLEESFDTALIKGASFISLDNIRGKVNSPTIESFLTEDSYQARMPFCAAVDIDPRRICLMLTSNRAEITQDLANRSSCVRILKHPDGHEFVEFPEGDILDHIHANRGQYLGAVFAVIREWHKQGSPKTTEGRHDFRKWARNLDWIVQRVLGMAPLLDGHRTTQQRMTSPALNWLRDVALEVRGSGQLGCWLRANQILTLLEDSADVEIPGLGERDDLEDDQTRKRIFQAMGRRLGKCFKHGEELPIDAITVKRREGKDELYRRVFEYEFTETATKDIVDGSSARTNSHQTPLYPAVEKLLREGGGPLI